MSSYFDRMARCARDPREVVALVRNQYKWYLTKLNREVLNQDLDKLNLLIAEFDRIKEEPLAQQDPVWEIQEMHSFAHKLAMANIRLRGGRKATDNPPIPY